MCGRTLVCVVDRADLDGGRPDDLPAVVVGRLGGRVISPDAGLDHAWDVLLRSGRRRLAVVSSDGTLLGLLCLKRTRRGFCSDQGVRARARPRRSGELVMA